MNIDMNRAENILTVSLKGRLDASSAPELETKLKLTSPGVSELIFDLEGLEYVSSAGLRVFLSAHKLMKKQNAAMTIKNVEPDVIDVFEVTGFSEILNIER